MKIRVIGCGAMGSAIAQVLAENGAQISLYDKHLDRAEGLARAITAHVAKRPLEEVESEDVMILAIKPQDFEDSIVELGDFKGRLVVSIMTGISLSQLQKAFTGSSVLRAMPNLAVRYGDGIIALAEDPALSESKSMIDELLAPLGATRWFPENKFDAVTALTGSGPAFVFTLVEAMVDAAVAMGFTAQEGYDLVKQMVGGSLTMLYESHELPSELRWQATSPAGATIAGYRMLEKSGVRSGIIETFLAAYNRSQELSES